MAALRKVDFPERQGKVLVAAGGALSVRRAVAVLLGREMVIITYRRPKLFVRLVLADQVPLQKLVMVVVAVVELVA